MSKLKAHEKELVGTISIPIYKTMDPKWGSGTIQMCFSDVGGEMIERGKKHGSIYGSIGGGMQISFEGDECTYAASMKDVWNQANELLKSTKKGNQ